MKDNRVFADVPRRLLTIAVIVGGLIGLALSQIFHWTDTTTFVYTLVIAAVCAEITVVGYRALRRKP